MITDPHSKDFELEELVIETAPGQEWDISLLMDEINVYEDIFNHTISADLVIDDADNRIKNFPITGHERIRIRFKTPGYGAIKLHLRIYKISARELEKDRRQLYLLHCVANEDFTNAQVRVSKAYKNRLISDIADDIQTTFLKSSFVNLETTKNLFHIIPGYWTPFHTQNFLAGRANSAAYNGANYVYFQTVDGFNFVSLEHLCAQRPVIRYLHQPANIREQEVEVGFKPRTVAVDQVAVQSYKFESNFDTLENLTRGMYGGRLLWHDIRNKRFGDTDFNYPSSYGEYVHVEPNSVKNGSSRLWTSVSDVDGVYGAHRFYTLGQPEQPTHVQKWVLQRVSQMQQIQNVRIHATVPGDSNRRVGEIVEFWLPSPEPLVQNQLQMDKHFMGRYLVTGLKHQVNKSQYITILELVKDSIFTAWP